MYEKIKCNAIDGDFDCHAAGAIRRTPWSSTRPRKKTQNTTRLLASAYHTFLLTKSENFIPQNGPSTQLIDATSFVKI